jgi:flavin reductase (DIM6/NTAB) family NADH-FMN oxidoreductase RutF
MERSSAMNEIAELVRRLSLGVYVVGVAHGDQRNAFTAAWVMPASFDPPLLALSLNPLNVSADLLHASGAFTVSVLKRGQIELARQFGTRSGRDHDKLAGVAWQPGRSGAPVLSDALAYFDCELTERVAAGDHELIVAHIVGGRILDPEAEPLLYTETGDLDGSSMLYRARF